MKWLWGLLGHLAGIRVERASTSVLIRMPRWIPRAWAADVVSKAAADMWFVDRRKTKIEAGDRWYRISWED
jgi:hypothetical protein